MAKTSTKKQFPNKKRKRTPKQDYKKVYYPKYHPEKTVEIKSLSITSVSATIPASAAFSAFAAMNPMGQGTNTGQRIGNVINMKRLRMRWTFYGGQNASTAVSHTQCRILILYDKQSNGATAAVLDYLNLDHFNGEFRERAKNARFLVVCDQISDMAIASDDNDRMMPISGVIDKKFDLQTVFSGTSNTSADIQTGTLIIAVAGNANAASALGTLEFDYSVDYTDN